MDRDGRERLQNLKSVIHDEYVREAEAVTRFKKKLLSTRAKLCSTEGRFGEGDEEVILKNIHQKKGTA